MKIFNPLLMLLLMLTSPLFSAQEDVEDKTGTRNVDTYHQHQTMSDDHGATPPFVLVTGANGLIGSSLVQELLKQGYRVRGSVRDPNEPTKTSVLKSFPNADSHLELVAFDLKETDPEAYRNLLVGNIEWVFHVAAIVDLKAASYSDEVELIQEAGQAMRLLLNAANNMPSVTQFVYTGSSSAIGQGHGGDPVRSRDGYVFNEDDWTNVHGPNVVSYAKIKTLTERAAWEFVEENNPRFRFTSLLPTIVLGPMTSDHNMSSMRLIQRIPGCKDPGLINVFVAICDMRDVVEAHIRAASLPDSTTAYRRRFLLTQTEGGSLFVPELSLVLRQHFGHMGYSIPSILIPKWIWWFLAWFDGELAMVYNMIKARLHYDTSRSQEALAMDYRSATETIIDAAHSLIHFGLLPKTKEYEAPTNMEF